MKRMFIKNKKGTWHNAFWSNFGAIVSTQNYQNPLKSTKFNKAKKWANQVVRGSKALKIERKIKKEEEEMSGHSKWHNIQAKKGKADAARGKIFTKLGRELLIAVKEGGPDPAGNSKLKNVIAKCKAANMPNDTINNAIKKASSSNENYEEIIYEGYGPNGVAVIVEAATDNKNRTAADVRHAFDKSGGNLGTSGCVSYMFNKKGIIVIEKAMASMEEEDLMMLALEAGAEDFQALEEIYEVVTDPSDFTVVREKLEEAGLEFLEAEVQMVPTTTVALDEKGVEKMERLIERLEDLDDVANIYHNWEE